MGKSKPFFVGLSGFGWGVCVSFLPDIPLFARILISAAGLGVAVGSGALLLCDHMGRPQRPLLKYLASGSVAILLSSLWFGYFASKIDSPYLTPGSEPEITTRCGTPPDGATTFLFGSTTSFSTRFPFPLVVIDGEPVVIVDRSDNGLMISATIRNHNGDLLARIDSNKFDFDKYGVYGEPIRPDRHTLIIIDKKGDTALDVRFLNQNTVMVLGKFYSEKKTELVIKRDVAVGNGNHMKNNNLIGGCLGNAPIQVSEYSFGY